MLEINWGDNTRTWIYSHFPSGWTWGQLHANRPKREQMLTSVPHRVDFIADLSDTRALPANMIPHLKHITNKRLKNEGFTIFIGVGYTVRSNLKIISAAVPETRKFIRIAQDMEEALAIVLKDREDDNDPA